MTDLVGEDSHTQLQVEVVRNRFSFGEAGSSQEPFPWCGPAYSEVWRKMQASWLRSWCWHWGGSAKGLSSLSAGAVGGQFQEVSMATLMPIKEHCQFCEHMLDGDLVFRERIGTVRSKLERTERLFGKRSHPLNRIPQCYMFLSLRRYFLRFLRSVTCKLIPKTFSKVSVFNAYFLHCLL